MTQVETSTVRTEVRPFRIDVPEEDLEDLRRRIAATNWPEKETVADQSQGIPLSLIHQQRLRRGVLGSWAVFEARRAVRWHHSPRG
jgi:hypothetical protein